MTPTAQLLLGMIGVATPFVLAGAAAWRSLNRSFQDMREDVAARRLAVDRPARERLVARALVLVALAG